MALRSVILLILISLPASFASTDEKLSAYQVLQQYDFPIGILPEGVIGYELNRDTGEFSAYLNGTCSFPIESYDLSYKSTIQGVISRGRITKLNGVSVKVLFFWLNIVELSRHGDELEFSVGIASASFPIDNFFESPQCGCGLYCNQLNGFVSSI
ncbi:hypothetical protein QUC31_004869 [Theobroma cacao]|uniref:Uncharacterized protein At5g01610 n=1 Tax=Theobroma cacao TaxID=3641 RepID=A0AB32VRC9_THECC|nr:PREDICTED: uncharacterized protein At5g01610 [Theobroma cacao]WRX08906.1 Protein of unknown function DUF538 - like 5 [Theobroma cacao]